MQFYSESHGIRNYGLVELRRLVRGVFTALLKNHYLAYSLGYSCIDGEGYLESHGSWVYGAAGDSWEAYFFARVRRLDLFPVEPIKDEWSEDRCFDFIQFMGQEVQQPVTTRYHSYNGCGVHPVTFDREAGLSGYLDMVNPMLRTYSHGWELRPDLTLIELAPPGLTELVEQEAPRAFSPDMKAEVANAIFKYRHRGATMDDRRDAVLGLARVLEHYRSHAKQHLKADEADFLTF